jgi:hypothetical protein
MPSEWRPSGTRREAWSGGDLRGPGCDAEGKPHRRARRPPGRLRRSGGRTSLGAAASSLAGHRPGVGRVGLCGLARADAYVATPCWNAAPIASASGKRAAATSRRLARQSRSRGRRGRAARTPRLPWANDARGSVRSISARAKQRGTEESNLEPRFWRPRCCRYTSAPSPAESRGGPGCPMAWLTSLP